MLSMPEGTRNARSCDLHMFPDPGNPDHKCKSKMVSIFQKKRMRGFWPFFNEAEGERVLAVSDYTRTLYLYHSVHCPKHNFSIGKA